MKERIVLASGAGGGELLKSLALHGANCFNLRILSSVDLARYLLTKSGITVKEGFINQTEENVYVVKALAGETYFGKVTYNDVVQIASTIRQMRSLVADEKDLKDILGKGLFKEKNEALYSVYQKYMELLAKNAVFDSISYIRYALENCGKMDAEFITLKEFPATPLENALLEKVSGGTVKCIGIQELFEKEDKPVHLESIRKCYGAPNEVVTMRFFMKSPLPSAVVFRL